MRVPRLLGLLTWLTFAIPGTSAAPIELTADFSQVSGLIRPLHGVNKGPLGPGGLIDLTAPFQELRLPGVRLHDCHWPNPDVVDIHVVFPRFEADPEDPGSYDFAATDAYLEAIRKTGASIVYRLGESIEHTPIRRHVHPPKDPAKWAAICLGIIRHYNEGWAQGHRWDIRYWEIWNEPENRPAMWSGTDQDYFRLYATTARAIRQRYPDLKLGGPAVGATGRLVKGEYQPTDFIVQFLETCQREGVPLDFFSWHGYTADPEEYAHRARGLRQLLDHHGFQRTESHLNEWNFLPGNSWDALSRSTPAEKRQQFYETQFGAEGAAFFVMTLLSLQEAPVDQAYFFHGELGGFGLFNEYGVPQKSFYAVRAFSRLLETPERVPVQGNRPGRLRALAGRNSTRTEASVLIANYSEPESALSLRFPHLPWTSSTEWEVYRVDSTSNHNAPERGRLEPGQSMNLSLPRPGVLLVRLRPQSR